MPPTTFALLIAGVILTAGLTVAAFFGALTTLAWALPVAIVAALIARYAVARIGSSGCQT